MKALIRRIAPRTSDDRAREDGGSLLGALRAGCACGEVT